MRATLSSRRVRLLPLLALLPTAACVSVPPLPPVAPTPLFDPLVFFAGRSDGAAELKIAFKRTVPVAVHSRGRVLADGTLLLEQRVEQQGERPRDRAWRIRAVAPGRYAGTLSDAAGPVSGETQGNRLHLAFAMKDGVAAQQWLTLSRDGQVADNVLVARKFGVTVAVLHETIRRAPR